MLVAFVLSLASQALALEVKVEGERSTKEVMK
jgi:hypothetical protein